MYCIEAIVRASDLTNASCILLHFDSYNKKDFDYANIKRLISAYKSHIIKKSIHLPVTE